jgi:arsenate reductase (glutaredoxin)
MTVHVYHYPRCSTCRKALAWLEANGIAFTAQDIVAAPPSAETLRHVLAKSGLEVKKLFNTSGEVYRQEGYKDRLATLSESEALAALASNGKLVKRPLILGDDFALVGFDAKRYAEALGR